MGPASYRAGTATAIGRCSGGNVGSSAVSTTSAKWNLPSAVNLLVSARNVTAGETANAFKVNFTGLTETDVKPAPGPALTLAVQVTV